MTAKKKSAHHAHKDSHKGHNVKPKKSILAPVIALVVIVALLFLIININKIFPSKGAVVATVNGENIYSSDIEWRYSKIDAASQALVTKEALLNQTITEKVLLQKAKEAGIVVSDKEVDALIDTMMIQAGMTKKDLTTKLKEQGLTVNEFKGLYKSQLIIGNFLNQTLKVGDVSDFEVSSYYSSNKDLMGNLTLSDVKEDIRSYLMQQKQLEQLQVYVDNVIKSSDVKMYPENLDSGASAIQDYGQLSQGTAVAGSTFDDTGDAVCTQDGKPIIRLFSTTWCPHCKWVKSTFDRVAKEYVDSGKIVAYHWELDTYDDTLTSATEKSVPNAEMAIFQNYNPQGGVPTFVLGCKYLRVGNGYEAQQDLKAEEAELRKVIDSLVAGN